MGVSGYEQTTSSTRAGGSRRVSRRGFLRTAAVATSAAGAVAVVPRAQSQSSLPSKPVPVEAELPPLPFVHGVASGGPLPEAVVIWTRITPEQNAMPGSGGGTPTSVRWRVALDPKMRQVVQ